MRSRAQKWGNSLAVRVPKAVTEKVGLREGDEVDIEAVAGGIRLKPVRTGPALKDLVRGITRDNVHEEQDFGRPVGREAW